MAEHRVASYHEHVVVRMVLSTLHCLENILLKSMTVIRWHAEIDSAYCT